MRGELPANSTCQSGMVLSKNWSYRAEDMTRFFFRLHSYYGDAPPYTVHRLAHCSQQSGRSCRRMRGLRHLHEDGG